MKTGQSLVLVATTFFAVFSSTDLTAQNRRLDEAIVISLTPENRIEINRLHLPADVDPFPASGILVWSERQVEYTESIAAFRKNTATRQSSRLSSVSRGEGAFVATSIQAANLSAYLDPLTDPEITRGKTFLTPPSQGTLSNSRLTIRRRSQDADPAIPADELTLVSGGQSATIPIALNQSTITFEDMLASLPTEWSKGLPAGEYQLRSEKGQEVSSFVVLDNGQQRKLCEYVRMLRGRFEDPHDPLYLQLLVESYLDQKDENGNPIPLIADAFDVLSEVPQEKLTPFLTMKYQEVLWQLGAGHRPIAAPDSDHVGIKEIDDARYLITAGRWIEAKQILDKVISSSDKRTRGLAALYRAVVLAEAAVGEELMSNSSSESNPVAWFQKSIEELKDNPGADLARVYNNYGNYLLRRTQDRISNRLVQSSTSISHPMLRALSTWSEARTLYEGALKLSASNEESAAVYVNLARLYFQMAELIRTIDVAPNGSRQFVEGEHAASVQSRECLLQAIKLAKTPDSLVEAVAEEMLAHLAYRENDWNGCSKHLTLAKQKYLATGSLAGLESIHRLRGMVALKQAADRDGVPVADPQKALADLQLSHLISETLRSRFPVDRIGLTRAGFAARRTYVDFMIVELLIDANKAQEALCHLERAKARALQDLLATRMISNQEGSDSSATSLEQILKKWPKDTVALEYFLGPERSWGFLVDKQGQVRAFPIRNLGGHPAFTPDLLADIGAFLKTIGDQPAKMTRRLEGKKGFDNEWESSLFELRLQLIPNDILNELRTAQTVIVVPQHILHYLPFAALVVEPDRTHHDSSTLSKSSFLIDESFTIGYSPSLTTWSQLRDADHGIQQARAVGISDFKNAPPLPGVKDDVENFKSAFAKQMDGVLFGEQSDEYHVKSLLRQPGIMLFATHGMNLADQPLESFLLFHGYRDKLGGSTEDGRLTAREIFASDIKTDLIVMSACYSGLSDRSPMAGDDLFGLQRAFLQSGAKAVVSGLWDVYDLTGVELMDGYFERLAEGEPTAKALAGAQRQFLKKYREEEVPGPFLHPYFWAVFTNCGSDLISCERN